MVDRLLICLFLERNMIKFKSDLAWYDLRITIFEKFLIATNDYILRVLDHDNNVIDINNVVLDKLEEILKVKGLE